MGLGPRLQRSLTQGISARGMMRRPSQHLIFANRERSELNMSLVARLAEIWNSPRGWSVRGPERSSANLFRAGGASWPKFGPERGRGGPAVAGPCPSSELVALASVFAPFVGRVEPHEVVVSVVVDHEEEAGDWVGNEWAMQPDRKVVDAFLRFLPGEAELAPKVGKDDEVGEFLLGHDLARDVAADRCDMTGVALVRGAGIEIYR